MWTVPGHRSATADGGSRWYARIHDDGARARTVVHDGMEWTRVRVHREPKLGECEFTSSRNSVSASSQRAQTH